MSNRNLPGLALLAVLALAAPAAAVFNSPTLLYDTPTADVLPAGSFAVSADATLPLTNTAKNVNYWEVDGNVRFSPLKNFDFAVTAYTLQDYVLDAKYVFLGGPGRFSMAVGMLDIGLNGWVSPLGHGWNATWPDWKYLDYRNKPLVDSIRPYENFSAFLVSTLPLGSFARLHLGLGRGRFVGYDGPNEYMNTDILFDAYHQWAFSFFGGMEIYVTPNVALVAEANSRDVNTGIKADFGPISAAVAWTKMEGLVWAADETPKFGRLEFGATYKFGPWVRHRAPQAPTRPAELPPVPEPEPPPPLAEALRLYPIWFRWDDAEITQVAAATLRRNAEVILSHPNIKVVIISGYASEEGAPDHNIPLSGRRAQAAFDFLKSLGVPPEQMITKAMGESAGRPLPMHRSVYFELQMEE
jgi:outer membrane protein OmpA-like peptidoglycan-associated protein